MVLTRKIYMATCVTQANDASCIGNKRGMARRAKRYSNEAMRQLMKKESNEGKIW